MSSPDNIEALLELSTARQYQAMLRFSWSTSKLDDDVNDLSGIEASEVWIQLQWGTMSCDATKNKKGKNY
ncbi:MAG: hypothetical protein ACLPWF_03225 [Bryobacteraceae bacterium]